MDSITAVFSLWLVLASVFGGKSAEAVPVPGATVGSLGRKEALVLEGNRSFTAEQIWTGLSWHLDFLVAAHPSAPLAEYVETLRKTIRAGYLREGFPEVKVEVEGRTNAQQLVLKISEGLRFTCGELVLSGPENLTNSAILKKFREALCGEEQVAAGKTNDVAPFFKGKPAPFDQTAQRMMTEAASNVLAELNYYRPKFNVKLVKKSGVPEVDLVLDILDEGIKGKITEFEVKGLTKNTREQFLAYLNLKPGMENQALIATSISNRLWQSARFIKQEVALVALEPGAFKLKFDLRELDVAPDLFQEFSPEAQAFLKMGEWLGEWKTRPENATLSVAFTSQWYTVNGEVALAPNGLVFVTKGGGPLGILESLLYGGILSSSEVGFYSGLRRHKLEAKHTRGGIAAFTHLIAEPDNENEPFHLAFGAGFDTEEKAFRFDLRLAPVALVEGASRDWIKSQEGGVLTLSVAKGGSGAWPGFVKVDTRNGQLMEAGVSGSNGYARLRFEKGAFDRIVRTIENTTASFTNEYQPGKALSTGAAFFTADIAQNPFLNSITNLVIGPEIWQTAYLVASRLAASPQINLKTVFAPLERIKIFTVRGEERSFNVPLEDVFSSGESAHNFYAMAGAYAIKETDQFWAPGSWPWILTHETGFMLAGRSKYSVLELNKLAKSKQVGPLACVVAVKGLSALRRPEVGTPFAARGVSCLTLPEFEKDLRTLLHGNSVGNQLCSNALSMLTVLSDEDARQVGKLVKPEEAEFIVQALSALRGAGNKPLDEALHPVLERYWEKIIKPRILVMLEPFLPLDVEPVTAEGQYYRGARYFFGKGVKSNPTEAGKWLRKAAEQGQAEAQFRLAQLYVIGEGVPQDSFEAVKWYEKALAQKWPHAGCYLGALYQAGRGALPANHALAARYYRLEAEGGCANAQYITGVFCVPDNDKPGADWKEALSWLHKAADQNNANAQFVLGKIYERTNKVEGMKWFRLAADNGHLEAQQRVGDILSDEFAGTPDYPEAYFYLSLASAQGDRVSRAAMNRVERKLTSEQLRKAMHRADRVAARQRADKLKASGESE